MRMSIINWYCLSAFFVAGIVRGANQPQAVTAPRPVSNVVPNVITPSTPGPVQTVPAPEVTPAAAVASTVQAVTPQPVQPPVIIQSQQPGGVVPQQGAVVPASATTQPSITSVVPVTQQAGTSIVVPPVQVPVASPTQPVTTMVPSLAQSVPPSQPVPVTPQATTNGAPKPVRPTVPTPPTPAQAVTTQQTERGAQRPVSIESDDQTGIPNLDNVDLTGAAGNWFLKRAWREKGHERFFKIRARMDELLQLRNSFFKKKSELEREVTDPFYLAAGFEQGEATAILDATVAEVKQLREKKGSLNQQEREFEERLGAEGFATLEQLQKNMKAVADADNSIDDAISLVSDQYNLCRSYEKNAWDDLTEIERVLSDKRASDLYWSMNRHYKNISDVFDYVQQPFADYFQKIVTSVKEHMSQIKDAMHKLKERGLDFKQRAQVLKDQAEQRVKTETEPVVKTEEVTVTAWGRIQQFAAHIYNTIAGWFSSAYHAVTGLFTKAPTESAGRHEQPMIVEVAPVVVPVVDVVQTPQEGVQSQVIQEVVPAPTEPTETLEVDLKMPQEPISESQVEGVSAS